MNRNQRGYACWSGLMLALLAATACATPNDPLSPHSLLQEIKTHGARSVVARLHEDVTVPGKTGGLPAVIHNKGWYHVLEQIATGDTQWLDVARALYPGSDAGAAEALQIVVAEALPKAPAQVLRMLGTDYRGYEFKIVCSAPHNEPPPGVVEAYLQQAEAALLALRVPELEERRQLCLQYIREGKQRLRELAEAPLSTYDGLIFTLMHALEKRKEDPRVVLQELRRDALLQWDPFLNLVERGDPRALTVVRLLRPGIDHEVAAELVPALAHALAQAPHLVLSLVDDRLIIQEICGAPFIGAESEYTVPLRSPFTDAQRLLGREAALRNYFSDARRLLEEMAARETSHLEKAKQRACLKRLEEAKKMQAGGSR